MHIRALLIKFIMVTAILWIVLGGYYEVSFTNILITSVLLTGFSYVLDVYVLPRIGNVFATITDFVVAWVGIWLVGSFLFSDLIPLGRASLISAAIITVGEMFFHQYMEKQVFDTESSNPEDHKRHYKGNLQTEFGEDMDIQTAAQAKKKDLHIIKSKKQRKKPRR